MPKVTKEYIEEKKNSIMDCTKELIKDIPLYQLTMRDIIKKIGFSQGLIYRYYQGLDEIFVDLMNRETRDIELEEQIDRLLEQGNNHQEKLNQLFEILGNYIMEVQQRVGGKFYYEIAASYAFDKVKREKYLPCLIFKQNLMMFQEKIVDYILKNVETGVFKPSLPLEVIITYVGVTIDGISYHSALLEENDIERVREEIMLLFKILADYLTSNLLKGGK